MYLNRMRAQVKEIQNKIKEKTETDPNEKDEPDLKLTSRMDNASGRKAADFEQKDFGCWMINTKDTGEC